MKDVKTSI